MNSRCRNLFRWTIAAALTLLVGGGELARAQYGGRSSGGNFDAPRDARANTRNYRAPQTRSARAAQNPNQADRYNPQTWLNRQGWSDDGVQQAGGSVPQQRGAVRQASYNHRHMQGEEVMPMEEGMMFDSGPQEEYWDGHPPGNIGYEGQDGFGGGCESCGDGNCEGGSCGSSCGDSCGDCGKCRQKCCCVPCFLPDYWEVFAGPQGFKGPRDFGANGNFGFHEGINAAGPLGFISCMDLNYQIGWQAVQSDLSGTVLQDDYRRQYFATAGVFHRQDCGLNYGAVWDWQRDLYYDNIDLNQVRGQVSLVSPTGREIGFLGAVATNDDLGQGFNNPFQNIPAATWEVNDQFLGFYRWNFDCGGDFRLYGGFTGSKDGVVGSDFHVPFNDSWLIAGGFTYVIPDEGNHGVGPNALGAINEQWNITLGLTYVFGCKARSQQCSSPRPMFNVADNGSMLVQQQDPRAVR